MIVTTKVRVIAHTLLVLHLGTLASCYADGPSGTFAYGAKVRFGLDGTLRFPDFEMTYLGKRHVTPPQYPRGWWIHDFKVRGKDHEQTVSWSAGTGAIGPTRFKVNGADFQVELSHSDKLGSLREDELVVSPVRQDRD